MDSYKNMAAHRGKEQIALPFYAATRLLSDLDKRSEGDILALMFAILLLQPTRIQ